jgi:hypothetical protein
MQLHHKGIAGKPREHKVRWGFALSAVVLVAALGTAGRWNTPERERSLVQRSIKTAEQAGAGAFARSELDVALSTLDLAKNEIEAQKGKWFPNYDQAKELIGRARTHAENAKARVDTMRAIAS